MEESKRQALHNRMNYLFNNEEEKIKEKKHRELQTQHEEESRKRKIIVLTVYDLTKKYEDYDIQVDACRKMVTLKKPLEVKYLPQFKYECNYLGFNCEIGKRSIEDIFYRNRHI
jgi:hypothetical protein